MEATDILAKVGSNPRATRVLLALGMIALLTLAADPAAAGCSGPSDPTEPICKT